MATFLSGKISGVSVDGTVCALQEWSVTDAGDDLDTTNFESNGKGEGIIGIEECQFTMRGDWDSDQNPMDDPPAIYPRSDLADTKLFIDVDAALSYDFPVARCLADTTATQVRSKVTFDANCKSNGDYTRPSG